MRVEVIHNFSLTMAPKSLTMAHLTNDGTLPLYRWHRTSLTKAHHLSNNGTIDTTFLIKFKDLGWA